MQPSTQFRLPMAGANPFNNIFPKFHFASQYMGKVNEENLNSNEF
jgi:hypothetical protein